MTEGDQGWLHRLNGAVTLWLARVAAVIMAFLALITFSDVGARYLFNKPFNFSVEVTELAMGLMVYLGLGYVTHENGHVRVDFFTLKLGARVRAAIELLTSLIALAFLAVMVWRLWMRALVLFEKHDVSQVLHLPFWPVAFAMATASLLLLTGVFLWLLAALRQLRQP
jgi:TRAP-type C4-dicarboxylate transport system permease small subunit